MEVAKKRLSAFVISISFSLLALNLLAYWLFLYWRFWWFDIIMHFLGGLLLGFLAVWLARFSGRVRLDVRPPSLFILIVTSFAVFGGVAWEFFEFAVRYYPYSFSSSGSENFIFGRAGLADTVSDLFFDLVGGFSAGIYSFKKFSYNEKTAYENDK